MLPGVAGSATRPHRRQQAFIVGRRQSVAPSCGKNINNTSAAPPSGCVGCARLGGQHAPTTTMPPKLFLNVNASTQSFRPNEEPSQVRNVLSFWLKYHAPSAQRHADSPPMPTAAVRPVHRAGALGHTQALQVLPGVRVQQRGHEAQRHDFPPRHRRRLPPAVLPGARRWRQQSTLLYMDCSPPAPKLQNTLTPFLTYLPYIP